jgi:integrase
MATIIRDKNPRKPWTVRYFHENRQRERSFVTKREATDFVAKFDHDRRESIFIDPRESKIMFTDYASQWIERRNLAPRSREGYRTVLSAWIAPALGGRTLAQVAADREAVQELLTVTMVNGTADRRGVGASRIKQARALIMSVMNEAVLAERIAKHRLAGIEAGGETSKPEEIRIASRAQVALIASGLRPNLALVAWLMYGCGLRISEALAVNLHAFRDNGTVLRISEQIARDRSVAPLKHRDADQYRDVPVPPWLWIMVQAHVAEFGADDGYLFTRNGMRVNYHGFKSAFDAAACKAGLPDYGPHQLRHTYASKLLHNGVTITELAHWLGHKDINVTHATYGHLVPDAWTRGRAALETLMND